MTVTDFPITGNSGWAYGSGNSAANAQAGAAISAIGSDLYAGQSQFVGTWYDHQSLLEWDTSSIPDTSIIISAALKMWILNDGSVQDFVVEARLWPYGSLTSADWRTATQLGALPLMASLTTVGLTSGAYNTFTDTALVANINKTGVTQMVISSDRQRTGSAVTVDEYVQFSTTAGQLPTLTVTHVPTMARALCGVGGVSVSPLVIPTAVGGYVG